MPQRPPDVTPEMRDRRPHRGAARGRTSPDPTSPSTPRRWACRRAATASASCSCAIGGCGPPSSRSRGEALDPVRPAASRAPRLKRLMEERRVLKVFHFARFDVAALAHWLGIAVAPLYCTRTASKLARTYTDRHGLKDNLLEFLDVELDKVTRHSDWSSPRLAPEQVRYAIADVTMLLPLMDRLEEMLGREGRDRARPRVLRGDPDDGEARRGRLRRAVRALPRARTAWPAREGLGPFPSRGRRFPRSPPHRRG